MRIWWGLGGPRWSRKKATPFQGKTAFLRMFFARTASAASGPFLSLEWQNFDSCVPLETRQKPCIAAQKQPSPPDGGEGRGGAAVAWKNRNLDSRLRGNDGLNVSGCLNDTPCPNHLPQGVSRTHEGVYQSLSTQPAIPLIPHRRSPAVRGRAEGGGRAAANPCARDQPPRRPKRKENRRSFSPPVPHTSADS